MLEKLIDEIRTGGTLQPAALANRLGISVGLVEMMLEDLERRGMLAQVNTSCGDTCGGCALMGECAIQNPQGRMWILTRKKSG